MAYKETNNTMKAFFEGKVRNEITESKLVELGHGKGVGHSYGSQSQYIKELSEQRTKGNGTISIGKYVTEKDIGSLVGIDEMSQYWTITTDEYKKVKTVIFEVLNEILKD